MVFSVLVNSQWPKQAFMNQLYAELYGNKTVTVLQNLSTKTEQFFKWLKKAWKLIFVNKSYMIVILHVHYVLYNSNGDQFLFPQEIYAS